MDITFKVPQIADSIIMVAGVGGGGGSAVKHLYSLDNANVAFAIINTDKQALDRNPITTKIMLGNGLGAGNKPEVARVAAEASQDAIRELLTIHDTKMLFVTAGMGGGTGTGASPVVARIAQEMGILTVGIVSIPYKGEGPKRVAQAVTGIEELIPNVDSLIVINNEHIAQIYGKLGISEAHAKADDILAMAAKSIADILNKHMEVNVDFADITTTMKDDSAESNMVGKIALMGSATGSAEGEDRAMKIAEEAVNSPLLHHNDIRGAKKVLLNITWGDSQVSYDEVLQVMDFIQKRAGLTNDSASNQTDLIWGAGHDPALGNNIRITIVATGFDVQNIPAIRDYYASVLSPNKRVQTAPVAPAGPEKITLYADETAPVVKKVIDNNSDDDFDFKTYDAPTIMPSAREIEQPQWRQQPAHVEPVRIEPTQAARVELKTPQYAEGQRVVIDNESTQTMVEDDASYGLPAYLRRKVSLYTPVRDGSTKREMLDPDTPTTTTPEQSTITLFDN